MMNYADTASGALHSAMEYAQLMTEDVRVTKLAVKDGLYEIALLTLCQRYEFYVDAANGEVLGVNAGPTLDLGAIYDAEMIAVPARIA